MERSDNRDADHITEIVEIERRSGTSSPGPERHHDEEGASSSRGLPITQSPLASSNGSRPRNPYNSGIWIFIELIFTISQILASLAVLSLARLKDLHLFAWTIIYAAGCVATLPFLYWRFTGEEDQTSVPSRRNARRMTIGARVDVNMPVSLDFFLVWLIVGNFWIFLVGRHDVPYPVEAPFFFMRCMIFLKFWTLCYPCLFATRCCCLPYIISTWGFLPAYKLKTENRNGDDSDPIVEGVGEGGRTLAAGMEKEHAVTTRDAEQSMV